MNPDKTAIPPGRPDPDRKVDGQLAGRETAARPEVTRDGDHASPDAGSFLRRVLWRRLARSNSWWTFLVLMVLVTAFSIMRPEEFPTTFNLRNVATDAAVLLIVGVGMTFVIIMAGIDLSVGSVLVFAGVAAAKTMTAVAGPDAGWGAILLGVLAGLAAGAAWGAFNGFLIAKARVPALIVTLGSLGMALGLAQVLTEGQDVRGVPTRFTDTIGNGRFLGIPWLVVIALVVTALGALALATTRFGRRTYAVGSNAEAARRAGIAVDRHMIKVYALSGTLAGLAGVLSLARFTTTTIGGHANDSLGAIAAVVLGGTSLFGGIGTVVGTLIGVFIPAILQNGFVILGVQPFWQSVAVGAVLIAAVYADQLRRRGMQRR
ncbi:ABC transporter permease [Embleya scabrispora]|uniref:ABC transporter permease n=1 Tax=Embleya scabrispora TaxID=159449 RepID=UPI00037910F3|nr:ABC transporter permease [Embleya scabrispora]MYS87528.1 ABC transporter permease [Streptomyces sp. SID5474]